MQFTLSQLAHFDRCLFPGDFRDSLIAVGLDEWDAIGVSQYIIGQRRKDNNVGIVNVYQEYIGYKKIVDAIEKVVYDFFNN